MQWESLNHIILPLFISTAAPVEKQRDTIMSTSHQQVLAYCKDMPMAKSKDYSYPCRQQIEADCMDLSNNKACDLLAKLKDAERDAREKQILAREKVKDTTFWCKVRFDWEIDPGRKPAASNDFLDSLNSANLLSNDEMKKFSPSIQEKMLKLRQLKEKFSNDPIPAECRSNSDCRVEGIGRGCSSKFIYYSTLYGQPSVIQEILSFDKLDKAIKDERGDLAECAVIYPRHEPECQENICKAGLKQIGY